MTALHNVMTVRSMGMLLLVLALAGSTAACGNTTTAASTVSSLSIAGAVPSVGSSSQLTATATLGDGSTQDVTSLATWQSSNTDEATVSSAGVITAVSSGSVVVQATYSGVTGATTVDIP